MNAILVVLGFIGAGIVGWAIPAIASAMGIMNAFTDRKKVKIEEDKDERDAREAAVKQAYDIIRMQADAIKTMREESASELQILRAKFREMEEHSLKQDKRIRDLEDENSKLTIRLFKTEERLRQYEPGRTA